MIAVAQAIAKAVGERDPLDPKFLRESAYGDMAMAAINALIDASWDFEGGDKIRAFLRQQIKQ